MKLLPISTDQIRELCDEAREDSKISWIFRSELPLDGQVRIPVRFTYELKEVKCRQAQSNETPIDIFWINWPDPVVAIQVEPEVRSGVPVPAQTFKLDYQGFPPSLSSLMEANRRVHMESAIESATQALESHREAVSNMARDEWEY